MNKNSVKRQAKTTRREVSFFHPIVDSNEVLCDGHVTSTVFKLSKDQSQISHLSCEMLRNIPKCIYVSKLSSNLIIKIGAVNRIVIQKKLKLFIKLDRK